MRKRRKLVKSHKSDGDKNAQILHFEELICDSHTQEKLHDEEIAVTKIKTDPNYFFRYAKKHSICLNEIGPLMGPNKTLTSDKYEMCGWILRTFSTRETRTMMTLFKSLVLSRLDYASQLWSPHRLKSVYLLEKVQRSFTKHIAGMHTMPYEERLKHLNLYSIQRRRDRYQIIYLWKIIEKIVPNLSAPITCTYSERRSRSCAVLHVNVG